MSEPADLNADPLIEKLARLTPSAAGFDRDALLMEMGRASARPGRLWQALVGLLLVAQSLTLALYFTKPTIIQAPLAGVRPRTVDDAAPETPASNEPRSSPSPSPSPYLRAITTANIDALPPARPELDSVVPDQVWTVRSIFAVTVID
jgi:hypothetical protein